MPLIDNITTEQYKIGVWKITENENFLFSSISLSEDEKQYFSTIKNESRKKEWLTVRLILKTILNEKTEILYYKNGRPYLKKSTYNISITHSKEFVAVIIGKSKVFGIDIEKISEKPKRISHKFLSLNELEIYKKYNNDAYTFLWSAKESIFKLFSDYHLIFDTQILVPFVDFDNEGNFTAKVILDNKEIKQVVFYKRINKFILTWVVSNTI